MSQQVFNSLINSEMLSMSEQPNNSILQEKLPQSLSENIYKSNPQLISIQHEPIIKPVYDGNFILLNRSIKFLLNFLLTFLFIKFIIGNWPELSINQFVLLICTISSVLLYILDSVYPSCSL